MGPIAKPTLEQIVTFGTRNEDVKTLLTKYRPGKNALEVILADPAKKANADDAAITRSNNEKAITNGHNESLPNLLSRLGDDVMQLINSQLALFKVEMKEEANAFARSTAMIAVGAKSRRTSNGIFL